MKVKHLDHVRMSVHDFDETANWYARVFGFEIVERGEQDGQPWGVIRSGDAMFCMYQRPDARPYDIRAIAEQGYLRIAHFALRITDREGWLKTIERENLELHYGGENHYPHSTSWYVIDPNGYEIEVALWNNDEVAFA